MKVSFAKRRARGGVPARSKPTPPKISKTLLRLFGTYSESYLRGHFHSVRLLANGEAKHCADLPVVIYLNHSSWWDPLLCLLLARRFFARRNSYGPMDAEALLRYRFFQRLGFFGIAEGARGAADFLEQAETILSLDDSALWLTPQGKFADNRARPLRFQSGLSHLARRVGRAAFLPLGLEYTFWEERLPEVLLSFGEPIVFDAARLLSVQDTTRLFESGLASVQDQLRGASERRQSDEWRILLHGSAGTSRVYDFWRRGRARFRGEKFDASHSGL